MGFEFFFFKTKHMTLRDVNRITLHNQWAYLEKVIKIRRIPSQRNSKWMKARWRGEGVREGGIWAVIVGGGGGRFAGWIKEAIVEEWVGEGGGAMTCQQANRITWQNRHPLDGFFRDMQSPLSPNRNFSLRGLFIQQTLRLATDPPPTASFRTFIIFHDKCDASPDWICTAGHPLKVTFWSLQHLCSHFPVFSPSHLIA